ncbi:lectin [Paracidovorax wautersii]|uniref:Ricin B lectin domain-containing protein n=1 Tax=Paracidovorax wautersii TaxID=1177982 RepID=A0ABU1IGP7_9BURK|nr:lectin [Paracidovorax wautersii]MDR6215723.1 hypothetical protein [Paracidovorax wautersii]
MRMRPTNAATLSLLAGTLALLQTTPVHAREFGVELQAQGGYQSYPLPEGTNHVELEQPLSDGCRLNRTWGYDLRSRTLWVSGGCGARFRIYTQDRPGRYGGFGEAPDRYGEPYPYGAPAVVAPPGGGQLLRGQNGLCLDVAGGLRAGNPLIAYRCAGGDNQRFTWTPYGELRAGHLCLDVEGGSQREGARVIAWECRDQPNQKWAWDRGSIRSQYTGMCLDIQGGRARSGQSVVMWPCSGSANQRWN